ncbi:hypothetical protein [Halostella litorea]|uniref:hypothetical protein n=1 Tax=Halostella litorea TaxID=2528831 RepID=UPI001092B60D|nr:hypothetical protein [Halostella litorea]
MVAVTIAEPHDATFAEDFRLATAVSVSYDRPHPDARADRGFRVREGDFWYWDDHSGREFEGFEVLELTPRGVVVRWVPHSAAERFAQEDRPAHRRDYDHLSYDWLGALVGDGRLRVFGRDTGFEGNSPVPHSRYV